MLGVELVVMLGMIAINCIFAAYEIALASVTPARLQQLTNERQTSAGVALYMKRNMEASLAVVQLGITLVGAIAAAVGGAGAEESIAPLLQSQFSLSSATAQVLAIALVVAPLTVLTIIFGELIPKVFALRNAEWVCLTLSPFMRWFAFSVWPAVWMFETVVTGIMSWGEKRLQGKDSSKTEASELQELRALASLARASRLIGGREEGIILGAADMARRPVGDIMLPADAINCLPADNSLADSLVLAHLDMHTRFPVVERQGDPQSIIGYVNVKDLVAILRLGSPHPTLRSIVRPIPSIVSSLPLSSCLEQLMREHTHIALVRAATGAVVGMITLEDILEELVGDITDEYDRLPTHIVASGAAWVLGGGVPLDRVKEATGVDLAADSSVSGAVTVNDWLAGHLGREIQSGDTVERAGLRVVVRKIRRDKAQEVQISPLAPG